MIELRSLLLAEDNLSNVELTLKPLNHGEFIGVARKVGAFWLVANVSLSVAMHYSN